MLFWGLVLSGLASVVLPVMAYNEWNDDDDSVDLEPEVDTSLLDDDTEGDTPDDTPIADDPPAEDPLAEVTFDEDGNAYVQAGVEGAERYYSETAEAERVFVSGEGDFDIRTNEGDDVIDASATEYNGFDITFQSLHAMPEQSVFVFPPCEDGEEDCYADNEDFIDQSNNLFAHQRLAAPYVDDFYHAISSHIEAQDGNDIIVLGDTPVRVFGGDGNDTIFLGEGHYDIFAGDGDDVVDGTGVQGKESYIRLGEGDDIAYGTDGNDSFRGEQGNDTLYGGPGDDILHSHGDRDYDFYQSEITRLYGGEDVLDGGPGNDLLLADDSDVLTGGDGEDLFKIFQRDPDDGTHAVITDYTPDEDILIIHLAATHYEGPHHELLDEIELYFHSRFLFTPIEVEDYDIVEEMGSSFIVYQDSILAELQNITNVPRDGIEITMS